MLGDLIVPCYDNEQQKLNTKVLFALLENFNFKFHMCHLRLLSKTFKEFIEKKVHLFCKDRLLYYSFKPGYIYPARNNKIVQLTNKVHLYMWHYFPDYNQWLFNYIIDKEIYFVIDELNNRRVSFCYNMMKYRKLKYLKVMNTNISGLYVNGLCQAAERVCFKNVVFQNINKDVSKSECKYITMKSCANLQNLDHTKFFACEQVNLVRCEIMRDNLKIFSESLKVLAIRRTFSVDSIVTKYLAFDSPFKNLQVLDLSYNQIEFNGLVFLLHSQAVFANTLKKLSLERNLIINSLVSIIGRL